MSQNTNEIMYIHQIQYKEWNHACLPKWRRAQLFELIYISSSCAIWVIKQSIFSEWRGWTVRCLQMQRLNVSTFAEYGEMLRIWISWWICIYVWNCFRPWISGLDVEFTIVKRKGFCRAFQVGLDSECFYAIHKHRAKISRFFIGRIFFPMVFARFL